MSNDMDDDGLKDVESVFPGDVSVISILSVTNRVIFVKLCIHHMYVH